MADAAQISQYQKACTQLLDFRTFGMARNTTDFKASFKNSMNNEEFVNLIEKLTLTRFDMVQALGQAIGPEEKIAAVDNYIPSIFLLMNTLSSSPTKPTFDKNIYFEWRGPLTVGEEYFKSSDVIFEVMMTLYAKALLHSAAAKSLVDTDPLNFVTDAGKHLLTASSVMMFIHDNIINMKWSHMFSPKAPNPLDINAYVCKGFALYFKASAQVMAAMKALHNDATPALIKARLCVAVINSAKGCLETLNSVSNLPRLSLFAHMGLMRELYTSIVCWQLALSNFDKKEMGMTMAYCNASKRCLLEQASRGGYGSSASEYRHMETGLPKPVTAQVKAAVDVLKYRLDALYKSADNDNRFIYFQVTPTTLPDLPVEANVMNPVPYVEPAYTGPPVVIVYKAPKGFIGGLISSLLGGDEDAKPAAGAAGAGAGTAAPPVGGVGIQNPQYIEGASAPPAPLSGGASPTTQQQADEAYARYLQSQYDKQSQQQAPLPPVASNGVSYPKL